MTMKNHVNALQSLKLAIVKEFEATIAKLEANYAELERANIETRRRVESLEAQLKSMTSAPDSSHRRVTFIGFENGRALDRITFITSWTETNFAGLCCSVGNTARAPMHNRTLTKVSYAELSDSDTRNTVLASVRSRGFPCNHNGKGIQVKPGFGPSTKLRKFYLSIYRP